MHTRAKGNIAEQLVANAIESWGWRLLERNFYCRSGEIDIVAQQQDQIVFIEVRSVTYASGISAAELLPAAKIIKLRKAINYWLLINDRIDRNWRLDYAGLIKQNSFYCIEYFRNI